MKKLSPTSHSWQFVPSLRIVLAVSFSLQILSFVGLVWFLSFHNSQRSVSELSAKLHTSISNQVDQHLDQYLSLPHKINQIDKQAIDLNLLNPKDTKQVEQFFWKQMQVFDIGYLSYANIKGDFIGIERLDNGQLLVNEVNASKKPKTLYIYQADRTGQRSKLLESKSWDPQSEAWYTETIAARKPIWSSIFQWQDKPEVMSITANTPVFDRNQKLQGVLSIDLIVTQISHFLQNLPNTDKSKIFIIEPNGKLVASSTQSPVYKFQQGRTLRLNATESADPLIQTTASYLRQQFPDLNQLQQSQALTFGHLGNQQLVRVTPWRDDLGLNWLIVITTPQSELMGQINENNRITAILCFLALVVAIATSFLMAQWLSRPLSQLTRASQSIAAGNLSQPIALQASSQEVTSLAQSFEQMRQGLQLARQELEAYAQSLEERVAQRTADLQATNAELEQTLYDLQTAQNHIVQSEKLVALGQLVASVAHEMNTPLGAIRSSIHNISTCLTEELEELPQFLQTLEPDQQDAFFALLHESLDSIVQASRLSSREKRQFRRNLVEQLEAQNITDPESVADTLVELGIYANLQSFQGLLQTQQSNEILSTVYNLASSQRSVQTITQATDAASKVVLALKAYAHHHPTGSPIAVNPVTSVEGALTLYQNLTKRGVTIEREYSQNVPEVWGFAEDLQQIWMNLIHNALQAMDYKGILHISVQEVDNMVQVSITDNGSGIDSETMPHIFEAFFTTKKQGEGSGLGLSIVKKLLDKHYGTITVSSQPGKTTFTVILPQLHQAGITSPSETEFADPADPTSATLSDPLALQGTISRSGDDRASDSQTPLNSR